MRLDRMSRSRYLVPALVAVSAFSYISSVSAATQPTKSFDPVPWQQDFAQLVAAVSDHYANLEWAIAERHMDLMKLKQTTETLLSEAHSDLEAKVALEKFVNSFGDVHFQIIWPKAEQDVSVSALSQHQNLCEQLDYSSNYNHSGIDISVLPQFIAVPGDEENLFPGGLLEESYHHKIGVIRIGVFMENGYPQVCAKAMKTLGITEATKCDAPCGDKIQLYVANFLTQALSRRAEALRKAGASRLLIDITGNGGGDNWAEIPPRILSSVPLHDSRYAFIRSDHWTTQLEKWDKEVEDDLTQNREPVDLLKTARRRLQDGIKESEGHCDRSPVWRNVKISCSQLIADSRFTTGILNYAAPGSFANLKSRTVLYDPLRYDYSESADRLPLYVAVDRNTYSAAEYFAALLQDNHAALVLGEPTGGAGCGYTEGGIPTTLRNSKAEVKMPDCVRIRADGTDAVYGVMPDFLIPWTKHDSDYERAEKLFVALGSIH